MNPSYDNSFGSFSSGGGDGVAGGDASINKTSSYTSFNDTGQDVVLSSGSSEQRKNLKKIVVLALCFVGVGLAVAMFLNKSFNSGNSKFDELKKYIEVGDGTEEDGDLIYAVAISSENQEEIANYYKELRKKEEGFFNSLKTENVVFDEYKVALRVLRDMIDYSEVENELIDVYSNGGTGGVKEFFDDNFGCDGLNSDLEAVCESNRKYYEMFIDGHAVFDKVGCYISGNYVIDCAMEKYGADGFYERISDLGLYNGNPMNLIDEIKKKKVSDSIVELNNTVMEILKNV